MIYQGLCLSEIDGKKVFIENCVTEDLLLVKIKKVKKDFIEAYPIELLQPSQFRVEPKCIHFGVCGGCVLQNMAYAAQLSSKQNIIIETIERIAKINTNEISPIISSDDLFFYRNKMEFSFSDKRWLINGVDYSEEEKNFALGLHFPGRFDKIVQIEECLLQSDFSNKIRNFFYDFFFQKKVKVFSLQNKDGLLKSLIIRESKNTNEKMINLVTTYFDPDLMNELKDKIQKNFPEVTTFVNVLSDKNISSTIGSENIVLFGPGFIIEKILDKKFIISPNSFFQTNTKQTEKMFDFVRNNVEDGDLLIDLFCGSGVIGILLADKFKKVIGIEIIEEAIKTAENNAKLNNVSNISFINYDLNKPFQLENIPSYQNLTIVLDPPRAGVSEKTLNFIKNLKPDKIIYISCNPTTQARDIKLLKDNYSIKKVQPIDLFPNTYHIENIIVMKII